MKEKIPLLLLASTSCSLNAAIFTFDVEIDDFNIGGSGAAEDIISYRITVPDLVPNTQAFPTQRFDYSILSLQATLGGVTTSFLPSEFIDTDISLSRYIDNLGPDDIVSFETSLPVPTLSTSILQDQSPLILNLTANYNSFGGFDSVPTLTGDASDLEFYDHTTFGFSGALHSFLLTDSSGATVAGFDGLAGIPTNSYEINVTNTSVSVPEPTTIFFGLSSLFGLTFFRKRLQS